MVKKQELLLLLGKILYGTLFVIILPIFLVYWSLILDRSINLPMPRWPVIAVSTILCGGLIILKGTLDLIIVGRGLPMNAYPPKKFVTQGIYAWFPHPIYLGAVLLSTGVALWFQSSSGFYIVTPILALMTLSLVYGYERLTVQRLFGRSTEHYQPLFSPPSPSNKKSTLVKKTAMSILIFTPWIIIGYLIDYVRFSGSNSGFFMNLLGQNWFEKLWLLPYLFILIKLLSARSERHLTQAVITGTIATWLGIYIYLILSIFKSEIISNALGWLLTSILVTFLAFNYPPIWGRLQQLSEWVANSRKDWLFLNGNFRIINHSIYSGLGGAIGVAVSGYILDNNLAVLLLILCSLIGATVFAQVMWGSSKLLRPFGYWGAIIGGIIGITLVYLIFRIPLSKVAVAAVLSAPFVQAVGRLRCLTQGCCHGVITNKSLGIRVWQSQSRVVVLSKLKGRYIHITQLYSILFNLLLGVLLWTLWFSHSVNSSIIIGLYLILTGIERFTEDAYRGEKQTRIIKGLKEPQWQAIVALVIGIIITMIPSSVPSEPIGKFGLPFIAAVLAGGVMAAFAMSMDFPKSTLRFSRLSG